MGAPLQCRGSVFRPVKQRDASSIHTILSSECFWWSPQFILSIAPHILTDLSVCHAPTPVNVRTDRHYVPCSLRCDKYAAVLCLELRTRSLPIAHVRVGNCWSHSRSRIQFPMFQSLKMTRQEWALPSTAFADLRPTDGDTCRTNEAKVEARWP